MAITPEKVKKNINGLIFLWQKSGFLYDSRNHNLFFKPARITEVTWGDDAFVLKGTEFSTISEYCALIENRQYSMLLSDGSFFQISYSFQRGEIVKHRLCWYPAPIKIWPLELNDATSISNLILEKMAALDFDEFKCRSPIRFDFAPDQVAEDHAEVHMHISEENCRIPVRTPLSLKEFVCFIINNFYNGIDGHHELYDKAITWDGRDTLTEKHKSKLHLNIFSSR